MKNKTERIKEDFTIKLIFF